MTFLNRLTLFMLFLVSLFFGLYDNYIAQAEGLVPCGLDSKYENRCTICHFFIGIKNVISFLMGLIFITSVLIIAIAGVMYVVSVGNESMTSMAKMAIKYALVGATIILVAWLAIYFIAVVLQVKGSVISTDSSGLTLSPGSWTFKCE